MRARVGELLGDAANRVIDVYAKANPGASPSDLYFLIASDERYCGPVMKIAERRAALGRGPGLPLLLPLGDAARGRPLQGAAHRRDPVRVRQRRRPRRRPRGVAGAMPLADQVSDAWLAFARSGDPNTGGLPRWPAFDAQRRATMVFDATSAVADDPLREQRMAMFAAKGFAG